MELNVLKGEATVSNLQLKRNLLDKFNLPVTIREGTPFVSLSHSIGYLGKVHLKVPWHDLQHQSAIIRVTDIFLLASALPEQVYFTDKRFLNCLGADTRRTRTAGTLDEVSETGFS